MVDAGFNVSPKKVSELTEMSLLAINSFNKLTMPEMARVDKIDLN